MTGPNPHLTEISMKAELVNKWENIISKIDRNLQSLAIEIEASIIEQYLSFIKERLSRQTKTEGITNLISLCKTRLNSISERWTIIRRKKIEQILNLKLNSSQLSDEIKELEVRFSLGDLEQRNYESGAGLLRGSLKKVEKEISEMRRIIDNMDTKMFRNSELLRNNFEK
jgi:hypothetical protein